MIQGSSLAQIEETFSSRMYGREAECARLSQLRQRIMIRCKTAL
jgi:hypothetical protein